MEQNANGAHLISYEHRDKLAHALACRIAMALWQALDRQSTAYLMLSGGSTPQAMLAALRQQPLPWGQIQITLADERWVNAQHADSNSRMIRETLLQGSAAAAQWRDLYTGDDTVEAGVQQLCRQPWVEQPPDVLVLGMGGDGHTASLFPDVAALNHWAGPDARAPLLAVHTAASPVPRISFSGRVLQRASHTLLHIHGADKRDVLEQARSKALPIAHFLPQAEIWWAP